MKKSFKYIAVIILLLAVFSCSRDDTGNKYSKFLSLEEAVSWDESYINTLVTNAAAAWPEIASLKPLISSGVDVYRIVYRTTVGDDEIEASGLLCVPSEKGEYPVISYQNGTNTVDAYAPSNFAIDTRYQLIELAASMGYIVLIPDYPGFGASSSIPHPYLVSGPTVQAITDMYHAVAEIDEPEIEGIVVKNRYFLMGYSQGGWATMQMHKALEAEYSEDFNLAGSVCGAGPYDILFLFRELLDETSYDMPSYLAYIVNAFSVYEQFSNPVTDIFNQPYASRLTSLFNGTLTLGQINSQLTTSLAELINPDFRTGFETDQKYSSVKNAMVVNSISPYKTLIPLKFYHGDEDTDVNPLVTTHFYDQMLHAGTSAETCSKEILPGLGHGDALLPSMINGLLFLKSLDDGK